MTPATPIHTRERLAGALEYARNARTILLIAVDKIQFEERAAAAPLELAANAADTLVDALEQAVSQL